MRFLLRQGIALRGHDDEGNLFQLLKLWSASDTRLKQWLREKMSPQVINELITMMGLNVLHSLLARFKQSIPAWYAVIVDEATDVTQSEQLTLTIQSVDDDYVISEDPIGLVSLPNTTADTIVSVIKDLICCILPLPLCRGQAHDGASAMQGRKKGVAMQIRVEVPAALPVHCFAHSLNLCLQDAAKKIKLLRDALETVREIKLINFSLKRKHLSMKLCNDEGVTLKPLCPTRWTVRTGAIDAVLKDYTILMDTMEEVSRTTHDEYGVKANGILSVLEKFETLFGLRLGHLLFGPVEEVSKTLQGKDTAMQEAVSAVRLGKRFYEQQREDKEFDKFCDRVVEEANHLKIGEPKLPHYRRAPARLDDGSQPHTYRTPKDYFRWQSIEKTNPAPC